MLGIHSLAKHHPYLLQGVLNFFMEQGKVALVASEDANTQDGFERALAQQVQAQLDCEIIHLEASADEDTLAAFNAILSKISVQQATQTTGQRQANYLLWVSENEHFTPERFQQLKNIILQLSGLQLKLLVSVTSDRWNDRLFDIAGRKIAYWFIPSGERVAPTTPTSPPPVNSVVAENLNESADAQGITATQHGEPVRPSGRKTNLGLPAVGLLVLIGAAAFWMQDRTSVAPTSTTGTSTPAPLPAETASASETQATQSEKPSSEARAPTQNNVVPEPSSQVSTVATPSATKSTDKPVKPETTPEVVAINTLTDCPTGGSTDAFPTAKPTSFIKDTNYIFIKSKQSRKICLAPAGGPYRLLNLPANQGTTAYGNGPWRVYSPDLRQIEIYFQGARVLLSANVKDRVTVIPR